MFKTNDKLVVENKVSITFPRMVVVDCKTSIGENDKTFVIEYVSPNTGCIQTCMYGSELEATARLNKLRLGNYEGVK